MNNLIRNIGNVALLAVNILLAINLFTACKTNCPVSDCKNGGFALECECQCPPGFTGPDCGQLACLECRNGGVCKDGSCQCPDGWGGPDCSVPVNPCSGANPCQNGGKCENGGCHCPPGCYGEFCETCTEYKTVKPGDLNQECVLFSDGGDKDFSGKGVVTKVTARVYVINQRELRVEVNAWMSQQVYDQYYLYTAGNLKKDYKIWEAPPGQRIVGINKAQYAQTNFVDRDNAVDIRAFQNNVIDRFEINAETDGLDLGECSFNYAYLTVKFSDFSVSLLPL